MELKKKNSSSPSSVDVGDATAVEVILGEENSARPCWQFLSNRLGRKAKGLTRPREGSCACTDGPTEAVLLTEAAMVLVNTEGPEKSRANMLCLCLSVWVRAVMLFFFVDNQMYTVCVCVPAAKIERRSDLGGVWHDCTRAETEIEHNRPQANSFIAFYLSTCLRGHWLTRKCYCEHLFIYCPGTFLIEPGGECEILCRPHFVTFRQTTRRKCASLRFKEQTEFDTKRNQKN